jgi:hypothetical protein
MAGFEDGVDGERWEVMAPSVPRESFIQTWASPAASLWDMTKTSPCKANAEAPDRILFVGVNWTFRTTMEWLSAYEGVIATIQKKYPSAKTIYLDTLIRGPGNRSCGGNDATSEVVTQPFVDDAIAQAVARHPTLVKAAAKLYVPSCSVFAGQGPHFTAAGMRSVAKVYADHYRSDQ